MQPHLVVMHVGAGSAGPIVHNKVGGGGAGGGPAGTGGGSQGAGWLSVIYSFGVHSAPRPAEVCAKAAYRLKCGEPLVGSRAEEHVCVLRL